MMPLSYALDRMGMPLYGCVPPTGYSSDSSAWVNTGALVNRMNFALNLAADKLPGIQTAWQANAGGELIREVADDASQMDITTDELRLEDWLIPGKVSDETRKTLLEQVESQAQTPTGRTVIQGALAQQINTAAQVTGKQKSPDSSELAAREKQDALLAGLLLGSPEFQRR